MKVMIVKLDVPAFNWVLFLALKDDQNAQGMGESQSLFAISPALQINLTVSGMMDSAIPGVIRPTLQSNFTDLQPGQGS